MAAVCHCAKPGKPVYKITRQDGTVNYCNVGDAVAVSWVLGLAKKIHCVEELSPAEAEHYFLERGLAEAGAGI
jgi:hypothetical protein